MHDSDWTNNSRWYVSGISQRTDSFLEVSEYRGKWLILIFYPGDFTFICPTELQELGTLYPEFQKLGAEILSVSTDSVFVHKAWHDTSPAIKGITYPMVADPTGQLSRSFGSYLTGC